MPGFEASEMDGAQVVDLPGGPGRPTGGEKTGGRRKGSKNRRTVEVEMFLRPALPAAKRRVKELLASKDEEIALKTATLLLGYVFGKPRERRELSGPDGSPIQQETQLIESAKRVAEVFTEVADTPAPAEVMTDESLGAVQAVNFVLAQKEAAERAQEPAHTSTPPTAEDRAPEPSESVRESTQESEPPAGNPEPPDIGHTLAFIESDLRITAHEGDRPGLPPVYQLHGHAGPMRRGPFDVVLELARKQAGGDLGPWIMQEPQPSIAPARVDQRSLSVPLPQVHRSRRQT